MTDPQVKTGRPSESSHWYDIHGNAVYEVPSADGKRMVKTTLAHARKLDLAPGVTSIIGCAAKPGLDNWKQDQAILAALTLPRDPNEPQEAWLARVREDAKSTAQKAAEEGTRIHAAVQQHMQHQPWDPAYDQHVKAVEALLTGMSLEWRSEVSCAHHLGYGTKADLVAPGHLIDMKGKDGDQAALDAMPLYEEHWMQLAATGNALKLPLETAHGILFVSRTHPGVVSLRWVGEDKLMQGWEMFQALLKYWQHKTGHHPFAGKEF